jgi:hydrogenase nickel incorporation protein HypA/HybF
MHEHGVAERILEVAVKHANASADGRPITDVYLAVGTLSEVSDESLGFYWEQVSRGTIAEGAKLHIERGPSELTCWGCGIKYTVNPETWMCPDCGFATDRNAVLHDVRLTAIDVATEPAPTQPHA